MISGATGTQKHASSIDTPSPQSLDDRRARWVHLLRYQHYEPVIFEVLSDELPKYTSSCVITSTDLVTHMRECALILASAPTVFFAAVEEYTTIQQRAHSQTSIYIHLVADQDGRAPSPTQYLVISNLVQDYLEEGQSEDAYHIDNTFPPFVPLQASRQGLRKYLNTSNTDRSPRRIATLQRLCTGISTRCSQMSPQLRDTPLQYPLAEVGYALNALKRLAQHRAHHSSNYIMHIVEDICTHLFRTNVLAQHFSMHQFVMYLIFRPSQAAIAEIFCSGLLQCWVDGGGGFNAYPAGRSISSSKKIGQEEWQEYGAQTRQESPLEERMQDMKGRADVWMRALDWRDEDDSNQTGETDLKSDAQLEDDYGHVIESSDPRHLGS